jgi:hypothetical protein
MHPACLHLHRPWGARHTRPDDQPGNSFLHGSATPQRPATLVGVRCNHPAHNSSPMKTANINAKPLVAKARRG